MALLKFRSGKGTDKNTMYINEGNIYIGDKLQSTFKERIPFTEGSIQSSGSSFVFQYLGDSLDENINSDRVVVAKIGFPNSFVITEFYLAAGESEGIMKTVTVTVHIDGTMYSSNQIFGKITLNTTQATITAQRLITKDFADANGNLETKSIGPASSVKILEVYKL